jgi:hypothetical protein
MSITDGIIICTFKAFEPLEPGDMVKSHYKQVKKITKKDKLSEIIGIVDSFLNIFPIEKGNDVHIQVFGRCKVNKDMEDIILCH